MEAFLWEGYFNRYLGLLDQGQLVDLQVMAMEEGPQVGDIYLGRIAQAIPSQEVYFVDIGQEKLAYLQGRDIAKPQRGQKPIAPGDWRLVQVKQASHGNKGPKVTDKLAIQGKLAVLLTGEHKVMASQKIRNTPWREAILKKIIEEEWLREIALVNDFVGAHEPMGLILRTQAQEISAQGLYEEVSLLALRLKAMGWQQLTHRRGLKPHCCYRATPPWRELLESWLDLGARLVEKPDVLIDLPIEAQLKHLIKRRHSIKNGCEIVIDELEALTAIDINSNAYVLDATSQQETALAINLSVINDLCRLIRLRNISGMILVDFINMLPENQRIAIGYLREALRHWDITDVDIKGFTKLGILEMAKKRVGKSLHQRLASSWSYKGESGLSDAFYWDLALLEIISTHWQVEAFILSANEEALDLWQANKLKLKQFLLSAMPTLMQLPEIWVERASATKRPVNVVRILPGEAGHRHNNSFRWL